MSSVACWNCEDENAESMCDHCGRPHCFGCVEDVDGEMACAECELFAFGVLPTLKEDLAKLEEKP